MKIGRFRRFVCIVLVLMVFASSVGVSFIEHHCSATNITKLFINEQHDCSDQKQHSSVHGACDGEEACHCPSLNVDMDGISFKCERCCNDSDNFFALDIPINVSSVTNSVKVVVEEVVLFCNFVTLSVLECVVTLIKESPPLSNILSPQVFIHFISTLLI